jgi:hypothetical protein
MTTFRCFWLEPTGRAAQSVLVDCSACNHYTRRDLGEVPFSEGEPRTSWSEFDWPTACEKCGHVFEFDNEDWRSSKREAILRRVDTGEVGTVDSFGPGAMWDATWMGRKGPDGRSLVVRLPGDHDWHVDSICANCNMREVEHQCWQREGEVPNVTIVGGPPGHAGGGSVWADSPDGWHGFLKRGYLQEATDPEPP